MKRWRYFRERQTDRQTDRDRLTLIDGRDTQIQKGRGYTEIETGRGRDVEDRFYFYSF